jgi:hypothetical protein
MPSCGVTSLEPLTTCLRLRSVYLGGCTSVTSVAPLLVCVRIWRRWTCTGVEFRLLSLRHSRLRGWSYSNKLPWCYPHYTEPTGPATHRHHATSQCRTILRDNSQLRR